ncbi:MAG: di-heme oxidoredictase family protein [Waterburya sp.]
MTTSSFRLPSKQLLYVALFSLAAILGVVLSNILGFAPESNPLAAGDLTILSRSSGAYEQAADSLTGKDLVRHREGDIAFDAVFVTPPAKVHSGLGPLFNNVSCAACHFKDGRGLPEQGQLLVRVSNPEKTANLDVPGRQYSLEATIDSENTPPVPGMGNQIQDQAVFANNPEATVAINWSEKTAQYKDGTTYKLRSPQPQITLFNGQSLPANVLTSLRIPPPVFGLGLLEAIPEKTIRNLADPEDKNGDGISGRPNEVWDGVKKQATLGRFGLKANNPNLLQQSAGAYVNDMGVTNPLFPAADGSMDIDDKTLKDNVFYVQTLGAPARTLVNRPEVKKGEKLFTQANCNACHISELKTGDHEVKILANQTIHPYTDLLLHDMGNGLADGRPDFQANGQEWRTSPLWGLGLTQTVLPNAGYLHDGRARTIEEAILWHDGEAKNAKETFQNLSTGDRTAMIQFLQSL